MSGSRALICATAPEKCLSSRSLRLPNSRVGMLQRTSKSLRRKSMIFMNSGARRYNPRKMQNFITPRCGPPGAAPLLRARYGVGNDEKLRGVLRRAAEANLEMQVRTGRSTGAAREGDAAAALQNIAFLHKQLGKMRVAGYQVIAVIDIDQVAVLRVEACKLHHACRRGDDGRAGVGKKIDAFVQRPLAGEGIDAAAEARGVVRGGPRQHGRHELLFHGLLEKLRFQHAEHVVAAFDLPRERNQLLVEVGERKILRRHE